MLCWLGKQCHEESHDLTSPHLFPHLYLSDMQGSKQFRYILPQAIDMCRSEAYQTALAHTTQLLYLTESKRQLIHQPSMYALCHGRVHANTMVRGNDMQDRHQALSAIAHNALLAQMHATELEKLQ